MPKIITGTCAYCGAPVERKLYPSRKIPEHMYCSEEHRHLSMRAEARKMRETQS